MCTCVCAKRKEDQPARSLGSKARAPHGLNDLGYRTDPIEFSNSSVATYMDDADLYLLQYFEVFTSVKSCIKA
jgi:hypothetical protein